MFFWSKARYCLPIAAGLLWFTKTSGEALTHTYATPRNPEEYSHYREGQKGGTYSNSYILGHADTQPHSQSSLALFSEPLASTAAWTQSTAKHCFY